MKSNFFIALAILSCFVLSSGGVAPSAAAVEIVAQQKDDEIKFIRGRVTFIYDGDTIRIKDRDGEFHVVRLQGVDAPEDRQNYSKQSRKSLSSIIIGKQVRVAYSKKDGDGRLVGTVYLGKADVNLKQIEAGAAWHYKRFASEQTAQERAAYAQAELTARAERAGLWREQNPPPPWEYGRVERRAPTQATETVLPKDELPSGSTDERKYIRGSRGGCYYVSASGKKVYVARELCDQ
jgi:endonuclease YncB( thermonuclease family)